MHGFYFKKNADIFAASYGIKHASVIFNAADIIVVGRFAGDNALAAVGSNTALINLLTNFFMGLSIGANVLVARYFGAKNDKDLSETVHTAMMLSIYSGIFLQ